MRVHLRLPAVVMTCLALGALTACSSSKETSNDAGHSRVPSATVTTPATVANGTPNAGSSVTSEDIGGIIFYHGGTPAEWPAHVPAPQGDIVQVFFEPESQVWESTVRHGEPVAELKRLVLALGDLGYQSYSLELGKWFPTGKMLIEDDKTSADATGHDTDVNIFIAPCPMGGGTCLTVVAGPTQEY